jgi:hypothetical protein
VHGHGIQVGWLTSGDVGFVADWRSSFEKDVMDEYELAHRF